VDFQHDQAGVRVVFGAGSLSRLPEELDRLGVLSAAIVHSNSQAGRAAALERRLGPRAAGTIDGARQHVPLELAESARESVRALHADVLIALGGGSAIGVAKAVALTEELPIVAVPTTYSGSEMTSIYGVSSNGRKRTGLDENVRPRTVIYDSDLSRELPLAVTAASALNALAHCVDSIWAPGATPITTALAEQGARYLCEGLVAVLERPADREARDALLLGASLAGWAISVTGTALQHQLVHAIAGSLDLPQADTHAVLLPHVARIKAPGVPEAAARLAAALGSDDGLEAGIRSLTTRAGVATGLRQLGVHPHDLDTAFDAARDAVCLSGGELRELLDAAYAT
jgi:maleylacetate reductase